MRGPPAIFCLFFSKCDSRPDKTTDFPKIVGKKTFFSRRLKITEMFKNVGEKTNIAYIGMTNRTTQKYLGIRTVLSPDSVLKLNVRFSAHDHRSAPILRKLQNAVKHFRTFYNTFKRFRMLQNAPEHFKPLQNTLGGLQQ